jgi:hypothetical protein
MNIPSEISSKILEKLKRNVVAWRLIVTNHKRLDNGDFAINTKPFWKVEKL